MKRVTTTEKFDEYGRVTERTTVTEDEAYLSLSPGQMYPIPFYPPEPNIAPRIDAPTITWSTTSGSSQARHEVKNV